MLIVIIACATCCATFAGGLFALRLKDKLHLVLGFSAGAVIAVAFFDLLPEAMALGEARYGFRTMMMWAALGFLVYLVLDRIQLLRSVRHSTRDDATEHAQPVHDHSHSHDHDHTGHHHAGIAPNVRRGWLGASSLSVHSLLDGIAIGLAFQASQTVGMVVAVAVLMHDFSDGINTANVVLKNTGDRRLALRWLAVDAFAPLVGIGSTYLFTLPATALAILLAVFSGFFLYIGASDLIPESYHAHPQFLTTLMTLLGAAVLYVAVAFANG